MPIYEYECTSCHHHFELMQKINDEPVSLCPICYTNTVVKQISAAGFQLKGTGWYATDFKNTKPQDSSAKEESASSAEQPKESSSSKTTQDGENK